MREGVETFLRFLAFIAGVWTIFPEDSGGVRRRRSCAVPVLHTVEISLEQRVSALLRFSAWLGTCRGVPGYGVSTTAMEHHCAIYCQQHCTCRKFYACIGGSRSTLASWSRVSGTPCRAMSCCPSRRDCGVCPGQRAGQKDAGGFCGPLEITEAAALRSCGRGRRGVADWGVRRLLNVQVSFPDLRGSSWLSRR